MTIVVYKLGKFIQRDENASYPYWRTKKEKRSINGKLSPREAKRRYGNFDDDFDDRWEAPL